jgi:asparagine synthase (glutamine-hydrolysing)
MCGINGFIILDNNLSLPSKNKDKATLQKMNDSIIHRGPDAEGIFLKKPIGFGFRRLSIIDLSDAANQPMMSQDGQIVLIFNGEIYNYIEVKEKLLEKGYTFRTDSDTEVIINSYLEYGDECVHQFNGMWGFALYDFRKERLFCARDRMGVKPFYYTIQDGALYFSSELKALHAVFQFDKANLSKVYEYLVYGYRSNDGETFLEDCFELLPGTIMTVEKGAIQTKKYWHLGRDMYHHNGHKDFFESFLQLFESAVKLRYRSDVPVALLLSGGLDSSSIAKVTDNLIEKGALGQNEIHAFIASFPGFIDDETPIAREFVDTCKHIQLHELHIDSKRTVDDFEKTIYGLDHPVFSFTSIAHNNIMKACQERGIKVVLNGQGSDEGYAGYDRYISGAHLLDQFLMPKGRFLTEFRHLNKTNGYSKAFLATQMLKSAMNSNYTAYLRARYQEKSVGCIDRDFVKNHYDHFQPDYQFSLKGGNLTNYMLNHINKHGLNQILHYEDVSSMMQSIEIRSPFMDYRLMEFAFSIPNDLKFKNGVTKRIIRDTIGAELPDSITKNRKKIGFRTPFPDYVAKDPTFKAYIFDTLNTAHFTQKSIWKADKIKKVFENPLRHKGFPFWRVINLQLWSKAYNIKNL